jgi:hypothetical protein
MLSRGIPASRSTDNSGVPVGTETALFIGWNVTLTVFSSIGIVQR